MWRKLWMMGLACLLAAHAALAHGQASPGVALVIGNGAYHQRPLPGPEQDARAMAHALRLQGYAVLLRQNLGHEAMLQAVREFRDALQAGGSGVFYFAGHGMQVGRRVLLLPVDAAPDKPAQWLAHATDLDILLQQLAPQKPGAPRLVLLDACLDSPFQAGPSPRPPLPAQTLVAYAARPGQAATGDAGHGAWTSALLRQMRAGGDTHALLGRAAAQVAKDTGGAQQPWVDSTLTSGLDFAAMPALSQSEAQAAGAGSYRRGVLPKDSAEQYELTFWDSIKDSSHASDYEAYLQAYPNGRFAGLARARIERLRAAAPKAEAQKQEAPRQDAQRPEAQRQETQRQDAPRPAPEKPRAAPARKPADSVPAAGAAPAGDPARADAAPPMLQKAGSDVRDCPACPLLAAVPRGTFTMGSSSSDPSERPPRRLSIDKAFAIGRTEVTVQQWNACVEAGACPRVSETARPATLPAGDISWDDTQAYVKWLTKVSGKPYRLPTEAEWEFAARGGTASRYWWGDEMKRGAANCKDCGEPWQADSPVPAGSFAANGYGLHDMSGSVWEWVQDCWHSSYKGAPADARAWEEAFCRQRVIRGGSWRDGASYMPASTRFKYDASVRHSQNGFRVARDLE